MARSRNEGCLRVRSVTAARPSCAAAARLVGLGMVLAAFGSTPAALAAPSTDPDPAPRDPNSQPPMAAPNGQPAHDSLRRDVDHTSDRSRRRRLMLTAAPMYASFRLPFIGRPRVPVRGGGFGLTAQIPVFAPFGLRADVSHTVHPVFDQYSVSEEDEITQTARGGLVQATHAGLSATFAMDIGRVTPSLNAGVGAMWIRSPETVVDGQRGGACGAQGVCDTGLTCGADNLCRVATTAQVQGGIAVDVLVRDRLAVGAELRYFALLTAPTSYPVYLVAALRATLRF